MKDAEFEERLRGWDGMGANPRGSILAVKLLREKSKPNMSFWSCCWLRVVCGLNHTW
jgi:hypothetical protein